MPRLSQKAFKAALIDALGKPKSEIKYIKGWGLRWEVEPGTKIYLNIRVTLEKGRAVGTLGATDASSHPYTTPCTSTDPAELISACQTNVLELAPLCRRVKLAHEINGLTVTRGHSKPLLFLRALEQLFAQADVACSFELSCDTYVLGSVTKLDGTTRRITSLFQTLLFSKSWRSHENVWPGRELAGL